MGREVAWRRYLLTSATGAATAFQQQFKEQTLGRAVTFWFLWEKEALRKDFSRGHKLVIIQNTADFLFSQ